MPREPYDIDGEQVQKLASYGCTQEEIADFFGCERTVIGRRFAREFALGKANVRINVRKWQIRRARKGSDTMLIHLGKQYCGQAEKVEAKTTTEAAVVILPDNGRNRGTIEPPGDPPATGPAD